MMKILTYFAFTLLSVLIQFGLMDYIQANLQDEKIKDLNSTSQKKRFSDIVHEFSQKPHALYYQTKGTKLEKTDIKLAKNKIQINTTTVSTNMTIPDQAIEAGYPTTTVYDVLMYDENTTIAENGFTTEAADTTTEFDNVTELSIFNTKNLTTTKPPIPTKKKMHQDNCYCNLLYQVCDINCCCDDDCSEKEWLMFNCTEKGAKTNLINNQMFCSADTKYRPMLEGIDNLFCVAKTNLPDKRNTNYKEYNTLKVNEITEQTLKWHDKWRANKPLVFSKKSYSIGDPIWLLRNGSLSFIDLPASKINNNCDERTPIYFLKEQTAECNVVIRDLEMFYILRNINEANIISASEMTANSSVLNCTNLHCTNWTIIVCNEAACTKYDENLHEPACTDIVCTNLALEIEYIFYYHDSKITNVTLYLHTRNVSPKVPFLSQVIGVKFYLARNDSTEIVKLSGNPGYVIGLPVIASYEGGNYTSNFFSNESKLETVLAYPDNLNGVCYLSKTTKKIVTFGTNKRSKCRYVHTEQNAIKGVKSCQNIQDNLIKILGINRKIVVAPLGNPQELKDEDWIDLHLDMSDQLQTYGEINEDTLVCYNIIKKLLLVFGYADVSDITAKGKIKILSAKAIVMSQNFSFPDQSPSVIISVETSFVDITKPPVFEYAGSPHLNIHLPNDFFFPFPSNNVYRNNDCNVLMLLNFIVITFISK